jgi:OPA family glycerol-3-phosphate transporter-like MFS transporter
MLAKHSPRIAALPKAGISLRVYWQSFTVALLVVGYAGYYLCRSNLSVTLPMIQAELASRGMDPAIARLRLGSIASFGVLAYALSKFASGSAADFLGGRRNFLIGMAGAVLFTLGFAASGGSIAVMSLMWIGNRAIQAMGWAGMVKVASRWFSRKTYGTVMAVVSLSYLFGDAAARQFMAILIAKGFGWREVFYVAAGTLASIWIVTFFLLKETPADIGESEPEINPHNLYGQAGEKLVPGGLFDLLRPMFFSSSFRLACLLSLGFTLVRETFNLWTPSYLTQALGLTAADAAAKSALFPFFGGISVLAVGILSDRLGGASRALIMFAGLLASGAVLLWLAMGNFTTWTSLPVVLVALIAFLLVGPYSFLAGAVAMDFGGRQGSGTASGIIDGVGYLGGVLAGDSVARISAAFGWSGAFIALSVVCFLSSIAALRYTLRARVSALN